MQSKKLYLLGGLGSNNNIFENLKIEGIDYLHFLKWIEPLSENEDCCSYIDRLIPKIDKNSKNYLLGVSFGGIIVQDIFRLYPFKFEKVIIISSIKSKNEKGHIFNFLKKIQFLLNMIPKFAFDIKKIFLFVFKFKRNRNFIVEKYFDLSLTQKYFKWAIKYILNWNVDIFSTNKVWHIHGSRDKIFNIKYINKTDKTIVLNKATHLMIVTKYREINKILEYIINENN